jgi:DNA-binding MarR family transcriptional regulator
MSPDLPATFAVDADGLAYNPRLRHLVGADLPPEVLAVAEAFAAINQVARAGRFAMERWAARHGLSEARLQVLLILRKQPHGLPLVRLAEALEIAAPSLTGLIDHLEGDGLVVRQPDRSDRRSVLARLTALGRARVDAIWPDRLERQVGITDGISTAELVQLRHLCLRLAGNLQRAGSSPRPADPDAIRQPAPEPAGTRRRRAGTAGPGRSS